MKKFFQNNRNVIIIVSFLVLANVLFFHSFTLRSFEIISFGFLLYLFSSTQRKLDFSWKSFDVWSIVALIVSLWIILIFRSYQFIRMISMGGVLIGIIHLIYLLSIEKTEYTSFLELSLSPLRAIKHYFKAFQSPARTTKKLPKISLDRLWPILAGVVIGIPVVVVLLRLFSSDPVFGSKLTSFGDWLNGLNISEQILQRGFWTSLIFFFIFPFTKLARNKREIFSFKKLSNDSMLTTISTASGLITATVVSFIIIQWPYVFANVSKETDLKQFGVSTYSEYVTRGMSELLVAALIIYVVGWVGLTVLRERKNTKTIALPIIQSLLLSSFLTLLISVFRRLWLYQDHHGLSLIRIYGGIFLIWMTGHAITLIMRHWGKQVRWVRVELVFSIALLIFVGIFNAEKYIAINNPPTVNNRVDYVYLSKMSSDAIVGWEKSYAWASEMIEIGDGGDDFIDEDERRNLAYSGSILHNLISESVQLHLEYASNEKLYDLYNILIQHKLELSKYIISDSKKIYTKPEQKQALDLVEDHFNSLISESINPIIDYLEENKNGGLLNRIEIDNKNVYRKNIRIRYNPNNYCDPSARSCTHPWYAFGIKLIFEEEGENTEINTPFENFLEYNWSNSRAYINTKDAIALNDLLSTFRKFVKLHMQISSQPADQWDYEHDISLRSPLL